MDNETEIWTEHDKDRDATEFTVEHHRDVIEFTVEHDSDRGEEEDEAA